MAAQNLALESFWVDKAKYDDAERQYYERLGNVTLTPLADEVAKARQRLIEIRGNVEDVKQATESKSAPPQITGGDGTKTQIPPTPLVDKKIVPENVCEPIKSTVDVKLPEAIKIGSPKLHITGPLIQPKISEVETQKINEVPAIQDQPDIQTELINLVSSLEIKSELDSEVNIDTSSLMPQSKIETEVEAPKLQAVPDTIKEPKTKIEPVNTNKEIISVPIQPVKTNEPVILNTETVLAPVIQPEIPEPGACQIKSTLTTKALVEVKKPEKSKKEAENVPTCNMSSIDTGAIKFLERNILDFQKVLLTIQSQLNSFDSRIESLEKRLSSGEPVCKLPTAPARAPAPTPAKKPKQDDDDDDVDLFGSESEDDEAAAKIKEERLAAYNAKKSKKPALIAKSSIILDVKPWDDETDMKAMEAEVRKIEMDGLLWGASKLVPLAYGIHKLQINCVVEDDKVSIDALQEQIESIEDFVQSVDIAAFNKI